MPITKETVEAVHALAHATLGYTSDASQDVAAAVFAILAEDGDTVDTSRERLALLVGNEARSLYRADTAAQRNLATNDGRTDKRAAIPWEEMSTDAKRAAASKLYSGDAFAADPERLDAVLSAHSGVAGIFHRTTNRTGRPTGQQSTGENRQVWSALHTQHNAGRLDASTLDTLAPAPQNADTGATKRRTMGGRWEPVATGQKPGELLTTDGTVRYIRTRQSGEGIGPWTLEHVHSAETEAIRRADRQTLRDALSGHVAPLAHLTEAPRRDRAGAPLSAWSINWTALTHLMRVTDVTARRRAQRFVREAGIASHVNHRPSNVVRFLAAFWGHPTDAPAPPLVTYTHPAPQPRERYAGLGGKQSRDLLPNASDAPRVMVAAPVTRADYLVSADGTIDRLTTTSWTTPDRPRWQAHRTDSTLTPHARTARQHRSGVDPRYGRRGEHDADPTRPAPDTATENRPGAPLTAAGRRIAAEYEAARMTYAAARAACPWRI